LDAGLRDGTRRAVLRALAAVEATAILVTHDQAEAFSMASQVAVMREGHLVQTAAPSDLYAAPVDLATARFVGEAVVLPAVVQAGLATCALGRLPVRNQAPDGPADILVRPEQIGICPDGAAAGIPARVVEVTYYGPYAHLVLELQSPGLRVTARVAGFAIHPINQPVTVTVQGPVVGYPTAAT
jgi:iron(III) transport system ATP-binding protein